MSPPPVIVITGGSSGIGAATATRFAAGGWQVVITGRDPGTLESTLATIRAAGGAIEGVAVDVTDRPGLEALAARVATDYGRCDCCFVNAGIYHTAPVAEADPVAWAQQVEINLVGAFHTVQVFLPLVRASRGWYVLNSSIAGIKGYPHNSSYAASKFGLRGLAEALRAEEAHHGLRVTVLMPGPVATPLWTRRPGIPSPPQENMIPAESIADLLWHLATADARLQVEELLLTPSGYVR